MDDDGSIFPRGLRMIRNNGLGYFLGRSRTYVRERFLGRARMYFFRSKFKEFFENAMDLDGAAEILYDFEFLGLTMQPFQQRDEILGFMRLVNNLRPKTILEVGTGFGGTILLFTKVAVRDAEIIGIDLPPKMFTISCPSWMEQILKDMAGEGQTITLLRGNSHDDSTLTEVVCRLGDRKIDVLFIDGDHSYEGVKQDFETYSRLVRIGGVVAFHDIVPNSERPDIGVHRFWNEIKARHRHDEFSVETNRNGIGVVHLD